MGTLAEAGRRLREALAAPVRTEDDRARIVRNLRVSVWAGICGGTLGGLANLAVGRAATAVTPLLLALVLAGVLALLRRGRVQLAATAALLSLVVAVLVMMLVGQGAHDRAAMLFPVVILMAALTLDGRLLVATTASSVLSVVVAVRLEDTGVVPTPFTGRLGWLPIVTITIILVVTAVTARLLVADVVRAIDAARSRDERLLAANRELEARSAELERFTYVVSHDLKSPLVTIRGFLGYVERDARAGDLTRLTADVDRIRAATERMGRLLEDLLELSRTGRIDRPAQDVPLLELVREARALVEGRLGARGVRVEIEGPLAVVHGDVPRLVELVQNLLDNAAKFAGERDDPRVWIGSRPCDDGRVQVFVRDNGIGIDAADHERVFEVFHRLDPRYEGTGLGLALARRIVESHGGRIWVESEGRGRGSTFFFTLPAARGDAAAPGPPSARG
jgi:signal transduction histidine kinase